ncbi:hypothetical protein GCM10020229_37200 [Kitasatospora albolonga]|uniref:hypothetical protein n=1 Tax=Kitasatospora albolonga TaxID=68173 RepID=UPI0033770829
MECRPIERLVGRLPYAKAVGIQPRTLELWDRMGLTTPLAAYPLRLLDVLRGRPGHVLIRPDGHLAARFPLADEPAALAAHRKALGLSVA